MASKPNHVRLYSNCPSDLVPLLDAYVAAHHSSRGAVIIEAIKALVSPDSPNAPSGSSFNPANYSRAVAMAQKASQGRLDPITAATVVSAAITAFHSNERTHH